jgi:uncharacterized small protein (DUF1192 family)
MDIDNATLIGIFGACAAAVATIVGIFVRGSLSRIKLSQSEYAQIMKTNKVFRDEMRDELSLSKKELDESDAKVTILKAEIDRLRAENFRLQCTIGSNSTKTSP